jgi:LPS-assembly protein
MEKTLAFYIASPGWPVNIKTGRKEVKNHMQHRVFPIKRLPMRCSLITIALFASVSALPFGVATAADVMTPTPDSGVAALKEKTLKEQGVDFSADNLSYDRNGDLVIAEGNVILTHKGLVFHTDRVTYDRSAGQVIVEGDLWARDEDNNVLTADRLELRDDFEEGFIRNVGLILSDGSRVAARSGVRKETGKTTLDQAVYSPCEVCEDDPTPVWRIRSVKVIHDQNKKRISYRDATLEFLGVPVFYTPYLSHPDPSVHAASGLLPPSVGRSSELGVIARMPYYFSLAPHRDLTLEPVITTKEGPVLFGEYRQHTGPGRFNVDGSLTYVDKRDEFGIKPGGQEFRGHLFSSGKFNLPSLDNKGGDWQWGYDVGITSDDTYLRRYNVSDTDTLTSQAKVERFGRNSYASLTTQTFQGLRVEDDFGTTPLALPHLQYHYQGAPGLLGGRYSVDASALALTRVDGMDTRRISLNGGWSVPLVAPSGSIYELGVSLRGDVYHVDNSALPDDPAYAGSNGFEYRILPQLRLAWRMPFVKYGASSSQTIEPIVAVVAGLNGGNPDALPNEDSRVVGFDDTNLFATNRFSGLDRWEGGTRVDYGLRYGVNASGFSANALVGQSYRLKRDDEIPAGTGLEGKLSDVVTRLEVNLSPYLDIIHRMRLDQDSLAVRRNEANVIVGPPKFRVTAGYIDLKVGADDLDAATPLAPREEIRAGASWKITDRWTLAGDHTRDLDRGSAVSTRVGLTYEDECLIFGVAYDERFTRDRDIEPSTSIIFNISLKNLG